MIESAPSRQANLLLRLVTDIVRVVGARYFWYLCLTVLTGLTEAVSLTSVIPLLGLARVGSGGLQAGGKLGRLAVVVLERCGVSPTVTSLGAVVVGAFLVSTTLFLAQAYVGASLQTMYVYRWQRSLATAIFTARWEYFLRRRHGDLINALVTETKRLGGAFYETSMLLTGLVHSALFLAIAAALSGATTAILVCGGTILFLITRPLIGRAYLQGIGISRENAAFQSMAGEFVSGAKLLKATGTETEATRLLTETADRLRQHFVANAFDVQVGKGVFDFGAAAMGAGILVASQSILGTDPAVTLVILAIFVRLMPKLMGIQYSLQTMNVTLPAVELLQSLAADVEREAEALSSEPLPEALRQGPLEVSLRDLHVHYESVAAVSGVDLDIPAGRCTAIVGGSGAGKSTLIDAVLGLVPAGRGTVRINGVLLAELPIAALRRRIGYMCQETVLYNASIRDNILWGSPERGEAALKEAARIAGVDRFVQQSRDGYDTSVGDRGALLSGGERQRLGLVRAVLGNPGLLVLDEATSALDAETERTVTDAVAALKGTTTVIIITHRLSSARIADTICVMEDGRIVEQGSWDDLVARGGRFHELWSLQYANERGANVEA